jgi:hypothetical protein
MTDQIVAKMVQISSSLEENPKTLGQAKKTKKRTAGSAARNSAATPQPFEEAT